MCYQHSRSGVALILVLGVMAILLAALVVATDRSTEQSKDASRFGNGSRALGAVSAVISHHERDVMRLATLGDASNFSDWAIVFGKDNYGVDFVGDCEVRWKVEPARTAQVKDPAATTAIPYLVNPSPDPTYAPSSSGNEQPNSTLYMYKVSAEARLTAGADVISRAQGARFVTVMREPLFRYVIFYAQRGAKGDLEMGHADSVNIQGSVHSNGSIYLGGGLRVNDKLGQRGSFNGSLSASQTVIGPDANGQPVQVVGVDGVFRLSKPLMFSLLNSWPLSNTSLAAAGVPVGDWTADGSYNVTNALFPTETSIPAGGTAYAKSANGTVINPYRILSVSGAVTQGPDAGDGARIINGVALRGAGSATANDSRDQERSATRKWTVTAAADYSNRVRTISNGGTPVSLSKSMSNRPFEAQVLTSVDGDGNATTDEPEAARPVFIDQVTGNATFALSSTAPAIENPGTYLAMAMGGQGGVAMVRRTGGTGWDIRTRPDMLNPSAEPEQSGLIIRERPIPDTDYWPGSSSVDIVDPANPRYLPFAYGKQWYPTIDPFTTADVSDNLFRERPWDVTSPSATSNIDLTSANRVSSYATGGRLTLTAAAHPGPSDATTGNWTNYNGTAVNGIQRKSYFYRDPWRFVHLNKMKTDTTRNGLQLTYYQDSPYFDQVTGSTNALPFSGVQIPITVPADSVVASLSGRLGWAVAPAIPSAGYWSARWTGFISPATSNSYVFTVAAGSASDRVRVWVAGTRVAEANFSGGSFPSALTMTAGRYYPIVIEFSRLAPGAPGTAPVLSWQATGSASTTVPDNRLFPAQSQAVFSKTTLTAVQCRIDNPQAILGPASQKVGLMLRPDGATSYSLQGGSAYAMLGWSPTRGFFTQRRQVPTTQEQRTIGLFFIGKGNSPTQVADASGQVPDNPTTAGVGWNRTGYLLEVLAARGAVTTTTSYPTGITSTAVSWTTTPAAYTGPMSKDIGGGKIWTLLDNFRVGPYIGTQSWTPYRLQRLTKYQSQTVQLQNSLAPFLSSDGNKTLYVFTAPSANGQLASAGGTMGYNRTWFFSTAAGVAVASPSVTGYLTRNWPSANSDSPRANGTTVTRAGYQVGSATIAWPNSGSAIRINKNGVVSASASAADIATVTGLTITGVMNNPSIPMPAVTYPANAATTVPAAPSAPTLPDMTNAGLGRTFAVQRSNSTLTFDLNSVVTGSSTLPVAAQSQYLPQAPGWPASWASTPAWPATLGLRPDVWITAAAAGPLLATVPTTVTSALAGITAVTSPGSVTGGTGYLMKDDVKPSGWNTAKEVWLRLECTGTLVIFKAFAGSVPPSGAADPGWRTIGNSLDISGWSNGVLAGPCVQSGDKTSPTTVTFTDLRVETSLPAPSDIIDATDWDNTAGSTDDLSKYLISQYQVFFGTREITEDFFTYREPGTQRRLANEEWFYNPREFWSQSRWWDTTNAAGTRLEKDAFTAPATTFSSTRYRELLAKTTVLSLDLGALQTYLGTRTLGVAESDVISGVGSIPAATGSPLALMASKFNGLIYAVRTNRYPWNPNTNTLLGASETGVNPWSPLLSTGLAAFPNSVATAGGAIPLVANGARDDTPSRALDAMSAADLLLSGIHKLQPYALPQAPAFKPQRFHHGVRIINCANIAWNYPAGSSSGSNTAGGTNWTHVPTPAYGSCKLSVVTPNQLYVQGSLNVDDHVVTYKGRSVSKPTPMAIMGDQITLLSKSWSDAAYQQPGIVGSNVSGAGSVTGSGTLACATFGAAASATSYQAGIVTNNLPTTQERVREGQGAPFVDSVLFLENWNNQAMNYLGSLVVLDSRRYTRSFLHDSFKTYGTTPFGIAGASASDPWVSVFGAAAPDWIGQSPAVFSEPIRTYAFNYDFITSEGTPPFVPFGVSSNGTGGWARIIQ
jgi:hypothetical protein